MEDIVTKMGITNNHIIITIKKIYLSKITIKAEDEIIIINIVKIGNECILLK